MPLVAPVFDERERTAAEVFLGCAPSGSGRVLIVDDQTGLVESGLVALGWSAHHWRRNAGPLGPASAWPEGAGYDAACVRLSKDKGAFEMALHAVASVTKPEAPIWVYGTNDEGIKSAPRRMQALLRRVSVLDARRHCRVLEGREPTETPALRDSLAAWEANVLLDFGDAQISQRSFPGVFAKGRLDAGTRLLLEHLPLFPDASEVLDYAAGSGVIGIGLRRRQPDLRLTLIEADAIALEAAKTNLPNAIPVLGYALTALPDHSRFAAIVANPPYHNGKARSTAVLRRLVQDAPRYLAPGGALWMVLQAQVNVSAELDVYFDDVVQIATNKRYKVWRAAQPKC